MEPIAKSGRRPRRTLDRLAITILAGVVAIAVGGAGLITVYLNRIGDAVSSANRAEALPSYVGRPSPVMINGKFTLNYLLLTTDEAGVLDGAVIAHLSASRSELTLVAVPANLWIGPDSAQSTLGTVFADNPLLAARAVESLTGARMDHQVQIDLGDFAGVVDTLGGITIDGEVYDGAGVVDHLSGSPNPRVRSVRIARMLKAAVSRSSLAAAIADPNQFDRLMSALEPCLTIDDGLTSSEFRATMAELRIRKESVGVWPLQAEASGDGVLADPVSLAALREALQSDVFPSTKIELPTAQPLPNLPIPTSAGSTYPSEKSSASATASGSTGGVTSASTKPSAQAPGGSTNPGTNTDTSSDR